MSSRGRRLLLLVILLVAAMGVWDVRTYTLAEVESRAIITVSDPGEALIATKGFRVSEKKVVLSTVLAVTPGGEPEEYSFVIENNMSVPLQRIKLDYAEDPLPGVSIHMQVPGGISRGHTATVDVFVEATPEANCESTPLFFEVPLTITAEWENGCAEIEVFLPVCVEPAPPPPPELPELLLLTEGNAPPFLLPGLALPEESDPQGNEDGLAEDPRAEATEEEIPPPAENEHEDTPPDEDGALDVGEVEQRKKRGKKPHEEPEPAPEKEPKEELDEEAEPAENTPLAAEEGALEAGEQEKESEEEPPDEEPETAPEEEPEEELEKELEEEPQEKSGSSDEEKPGEEDGSSTEGGSTQENSPAETIEEETAGENGLDIKGQDAEEEGSAAGNGS